MPAILCKSCRAPYPPTGMPFRCPQCGGYFDFDSPLTFDSASIEPDQPGFWRYRHSFALFPDSPVVSLGEGNTPLVWDRLEGVDIAYKMEALNPSGSYKDRNCAVMVSQLLGRGVDLAIEDSSGNAGASFAAYAARGGVRARIYVPETASGPKRAQIEMFGAELVAVPGPRSEAAKAVLQDAESGVAYASHAYMPFGLPGIATLAYELWETLGRAPGTILTPVGHGGLLRGVWMGFEALRLRGLIQQHPYYVAAQAAACAPLVAAYEHGMPAMRTIAEGATLAEGVRVRWPSQAEFLLGSIPPGAGTFLAIPEAEILPAYQELAARGVLVEPTSTLAWCALKRVLHHAPEPLVLLMTGSGLKFQPNPTE